MADETLREVSRQLRTAQDKYTYFLLAAAASGVALAINQTKEDTLNWSMLLLAIAVLGWGLSFYLGCRHVAWTNSSMYANYQLLLVEAGQHPQTGRNPQLASAASQGIREAIEHNSKVANRLGHWQFRMLITGALFYIGWHIIEMALRGSI